MDKELLSAIEDGLPIVSSPYTEVARRINTSEDDVIARLRRLLADGIIKRLGFVVRHRAVGFKANAMVVWDVPDADADRVGAGLSEHACVTLCYRRPRRRPEWPYNLFCMIHGRDRETVLQQIEDLSRSVGLVDVPNAILFSKQCFKQRGARFSAPKKELAS